MLVFAYMVCHRGQLLLNVNKTKQMNFTLRNDVLVEINSCQTFRFSPEFKVKLE